MYAMSLALGRCLVHVGHSVDYVFNEWATRGLAQSGREDLLGDR